MKQLTFAMGVAVAACIVLTAGSAQAALIERGTGTFTSDGVEYTKKLVYDDLLDVTWLNFTRDYVMDFEDQGWQDQRTWAAGLEVAFDGQTFDDWRLPRVLPVDGVEYDYTSTDDGSTDIGFNISAPGSAYPGSTGSEMAHLYYTSLGNLGRRDVDGNVQSGYGLEKEGPLTALQPWDYWSDTNYPSYTNYAWVFDFSDGGQMYDHKTDNRSAGIALREGDVGPTTPVPEPASILLWGSGLVGLAGMRRRLSRGVKHSRTARWV